MISVVTITYNNFSELKATLSSLKGLSEIESVVINGGSDPESREFLKTHSGTVVNEPDQGISDAFNKGVRYSKGEAIAFLNSGDTLLDHEYYLWANRALKEDPSIDFVYSDILFMDPVAGAITMKPRGKNRVDLGEGMPFPHPSMVVRRELFEKLGGFSMDYKIAMDFDFAVKLVSAGHRGTYYPQPTVKMDGAGVSSARELQAIMECKKSLLEHGVFQENRAKFDKRLLNYRIRAWVQNTFGNWALSTLKTLKSKLK